MLERIETTQIFRFYRLTAFLGRQSVAGSKAPIARARGYKLHYYVLILTHEFHRQKGTR